MRLYSVCKSCRTQNVFLHIKKNAKVCFMECEAKLRVPLLSVSDRSIHSDDNMMHPPETFLSTPAETNLESPSLRCKVLKAPEVLSNYFRHYGLDVRLIPKLLTS